MDIKMVKIDDIVPYENNPRHNEDAVEPVKESIKAYGFRVPMILDKENIIVAGHTRYAAAQALGMDEVPVIYADDLTDEQIREFRLVDNKTSEFAGWDFSKLEEELAGMDFSDYDFGFHIEEENLTDYFTASPTGNSNKDTVSGGDYYENSPDIDYGADSQEEGHKKIQCPHCGKWFTPE